MWISSRNDPKGRCNDYGLENYALWRCQWVWDSSYGTFVPFVVFVFVVRSQPFWVRAIVSVMPWVIKVLHSAAAAAISLTSVCSISYNYISKRTLCRGGYYSPNLCSPPHTTILLITNFLFSFLFNPQMWCDSSNVRLHCLASIPFCAPIVLPHMYVWVSFLFEAFIFHDS